MPPRATSITCLVSIFDLPGWVVQPQPGQAGYEKPYEFR